MTVDMTSQSGLSLLTSSRIPTPLSLFNPYILPLSRTLKTYDVYTINAQSPFCLQTKYIIGFLFQRYNTPLRHDRTIPAVSGRRGAGRRRAR